MLVDSSVWIDYFRTRNVGLVAALERGEVHTHPFVIGELACGSLPRRATVLSWLTRLPTARIATDGEVHLLLERERLWSLGIGWIDLHLLASAMFTGVELWTRDTRLGAVAARLGVSR